MSLYRGGSFAWNLKGRCFTLCYIYYGHNPGVCETTPCSTVIAAAVVNGKQTLAGLTLTWIWGCTTCITSLGWGICFFAFIDLRFKACSALKEQRLRCRAHRAYFVLFYAMKGIIDAALIFNYTTQTISFLLYSYFIV